MSVWIWKGCKIHEDAFACTVTAHPEAFEVTYQGAVLAKRERNYRDDSDFYAVVWDEAEQRVKEVDYASTRGWTYTNGAKEDATPEVLAKARAYETAAALAAAQARARRAAAAPAKGKRVRVTGGRKVPVGTEGTVFWADRTVAFRFRNYRRLEAWMYEDRVGLAYLGADGKPREAFLRADQVEVVRPEQYLPAEAELRASVAEVEDPGTAHARRVAVAAGMAFL